MAALRNPITARKAMGARSFMAVLTRGLSHFMKQHEHAINSLFFMGAQFAACGPVRGFGLVVTLVGNANGKDGIRHEKDHPSSPLRLLSLRDRYSVGREPNTASAGKTRHGQSPPHTGSHHNGWGGYGWLGQSWRPPLNPSQRAL